MRPHSESQAGCYRLAAESVRPGAGVDSGHRRRSAIRDAEISNDRYHVGALAPPRTISDPLRRIQQWMTAWQPRSGRIPMALSALA